MKLRYYLRGIGLGIIVAAAICMCATINNKKTELTDDQIKERAEALGMIDSKTTLSDVAADSNVNIVDSPDAGEFVEVKPEEIDYPQEETAEETDTFNEEEADAVDIEVAEEAEATEEVEAEAAVEADKEENINKEVEEPKEEVKEPVGDIITIMVDKGNGSDTVARRLAEAGLVPNANEYDKYLMANGYDRRIAAGVHKIPKGASDEEIAKLLVSKQD